MVFRLVGLIGLIFLPWLASADEVGVHQALGKWVLDKGVGTASYAPEDGFGGLPEDWPRWLLHPGDADALNSAFLRRGLFPEAVSLDWVDGAGTVEVFGARRGPDGGLRLVVDRRGQRPVLLRTASGVHWRFEDYTARGGRSSALPQRIVRIPPEGERTVFAVR